MTEARQKRKVNKGPGPEADRLKIEGWWTDAVRKSLKKKIPESGLPRPPKKYKTKTGK